MLISLDLNIGCTLSPAWKVWGRVRFPCLHIGGGAYVAKQLVFCKHSMAASNTILLKGFVGRFSSSDNVGNIGMWAFEIHDLLDSLAAYADCFESRGDSWAQVSSYLGCMLA